MSWITMKPAHPGCDEYNVKAQEIWHDPYALCAIISAYLGGEEWTIDSAYPVMERYFKLQYVLTEKITTETRYRTEQRVGQQLVTDPKTGAQRWESYTYEVEVPYTYRICDVKLENKNLSHQPVYSRSVRRKAARFPAQRPAFIRRAGGIQTG